MPFQKGLSGNPAGRPAGARNKASEAIRAKVESFLLSQINEVEAIWATLDGKEKMQFITKLLDFTLPKLRSVDSDMNININSLSESELDALVNSLLSKLNSDETEN